MIRTENMYIVYEDYKGEHHYQPYEDLTDSGTLIDDQGDDMTIIGWSL